MLGIIKCFNAETAVSKQYTSLSTLQNHVRSAHLGNTHPWTCSHCGTGHSDLRKLKEHIQALH